MIPIGKSEKDGELELISFPSFLQYNPFSDKKYILAVLIELSSLYYQTVYFFTI